MFVPYCFKIGRECPFGGEIEEDPRLVFVLIPFAPEFDEIYQQGIKPIWEELGFRVLRADEEFHVHDIMCRAICQNTQRARFIVADMTDRNSNVFYELGLAHAFGKPVILITQHKDDVPFDLQAILYINYGVGEENIAELRRGLKKMVQGLLETEAVPPPPSQKSVDLVSDREVRKLPEVIFGEQDSKEMILVPAGEFLMGTTEAMAKDLTEQLGQDFFSRETPQHRVHVPDFYIDRYPVTSAEFQRFVEATGYRTQAEKDGYGRVWSGSKWQQVKGADWCHPQGPQSSIEGRMDHSVVQVSWNDAVAYARWAGKRLLSEREWEKAARSSDGREWPWGSEWVEGKCNSREAGVGDTTPVGFYSPVSDSPYGVADVAGNVWEWTASCFVAYPGTTYESDDFGEQFQVVRGGSWFRDYLFARCACRFWYVRGGRGGDIGFRCARSSPLPET
jgi:formylglycine-generating enzyme required for sulfatase activity